MRDLTNMKHYPGGKSGTGSYQQIINQVPVHKLFISLFAGNCGVVRNMKLSSQTIVIDKNTSVSQEWSMSSGKYPSLLALNTDAISWIKNFNGSDRDNPETVIYADPPYLFESRKQKRNLYKHELSTQDHIDILSQLCALRSKVIISHYPAELYDKILHGWRTVDYESVTRLPGTVTERLYMNFDQPQELHDYRYIGNDFRERELYSKMRKNIINKLKRLSPMVRNAILYDVSSQYRLPGDIAQNCVPVRNA